jgi:2-keto-3-deoxy-L-rhamnonate aldolase RhmA
MEPILRNPARERLEAGELALGVGIRQSRTADIAAIMKACGYDWLFLQYGDDHIFDAYRTVVEACNAHRKTAGIGGVSEESPMRRYIGMGVRLVPGGGDLGFM